MRLDELASGTVGAAPAIHRPGVIATNGTGAVGGTGRAGSGRAGTGP